MGIHDRDYYRESSRRFFDPLGRHAGTIWLIAATCLIFLLDMISRDAGGNSVREWGVYDDRAVRRGEVWRLATRIFLHADLFHLAFNMLVLYWAGAALEEMFGTREFVAFYLLAGIGSGVVLFALQVFGLVASSMSLGASGAVTAVLVVFALHFPRQRVLLFFIIPMPVGLLVVLYIVLDLLGAMGIGRDGIGYVAHLAGAAFGFAYFKLGARITSWSYSRRPPQSRPRLRVIPAEDAPDTPLPRDDAPREAQPQLAGGYDEHFEARIDGILAKVSQQGQASLSPEERELLFQASERYKKKRK